MSDLKNILKQGGWSLFLDRDGVINQRPMGDYVKKVDDFIFKEGVLESMALLRDVFSPIVVVTNQQGIGKGLMSMSDVEKIHLYMKSQIAEHGGRLDAVFIAPQLRSDQGFMRKPGVGMGLKAKRQFSEICFSKSVMVGDTMSDMLFAKRLKMKSVFVGLDSDFDSEISFLVDYRFANLQEFTKYILQ